MKIGRMDKLGEIFIKELENFMKTATRQWVGDSDKVVKTVSYKQGVEN